MRFALPFKKRLSRKEWKLSVICTIIIAIMLSNFAFKQVHLKTKLLKDEINLTEARLAKLSELLKKKNEIECEYEEAVAGMPLLNSNGGLLRQIEAVAKEAGLNIRNIKPEEVRREGAYNIYSARIESQSNISTLAKFLYIFSEETRGIGVQNLRINAQSKNELPRVSLLISAVAFNE